MHYCGKILKETDLIDFIDIVNCTGWFMALSFDNSFWSFIDNLTYSLSGIKI